MPTNTTPVPTSNHVCAAFVNEYLNFREQHSWKTVLQRTLTYVQDRPTERKVECEEVVNKLLEMDTVEEQIKLILYLGTLARKAQQNKNKIKVPGLVTDASLWAMVLHAIRVFLVMSLMKKDGPDKQFFMNYCKDLKVKLKEHEAQIDKNLNRNLTTKNDRDEYSSIYNKLLDLQDWTTIKHALINNQFPKCLPAIEAPAIKDFPYNSEIPAVYNINFPLHYYINELQGTRELNFQAELRKLSCSKDNDGSDIYTIIDKEHFPIINLKQYLEDSAGEVFSPNSPTNEPTLVNQPMVEEVKPQGSQLGNLGIFSSYNQVQQQQLQQQQMQQQQQLQQQAYRQPDGRLQYY